MLADFFEKEFDSNEQAEKTEVSICLRKQYDFINDPIS